MKLLDFSKKLDQKLLKQKEDERLVNALLHTTKIDPKNNELTFTIGNGTESTNKEALGTWVSEKSIDIPMPYDKNTFMQLLDMLFIKLDSVV